MLEFLETEKSNPKTANLDELNIYDILRVINQEDATVPLTITENLQTIVSIVEICISTIENGGRIVYVGAGTSGRVAVIDAVETVPTFDVEPGTFYQ